MDGIRQADHTDHTDDGKPDAQCRESNQFMMTLVLLYDEANA